MDNPLKKLGESFDDLVKKAGDAVEIRLRRRMVADNIAVLITLDKDSPDMELYRRTLEALR